MKAHDTIKAVIVNGTAVEVLTPNHAEWEVRLKDTAALKLEAIAEDVHGNVEKRPQVVTLGGSS
ncbi:MAG: hypothetical protein ACKVY0_18665 [Prosthecobacter sp.]|uniref:hypothetical protein n=1 Tax=Prosthecobacter sp. TaxID=1965333 RepID=UPI0039042A46